MERLKRLFFVVLVVGMLFVGHAFGAEIKARPVAQTTNYETLPSSRSTVILGQLMPKSCCQEKCFLSWNRISLSRLRGGLESGTGASSRLDTS